MLFLSKNIKTDVSCLLFSESIKFEAQSLFETPCRVCLTRKMNKKSDRITNVTANVQNLSRKLAHMRIIPGAGQAKGESTTLFLHFVYRQGQVPTQEVTLLTTTK